MLRIFTSRVHRRVWMFYKNLEKVWYFWKWHIEFRNDNFYYLKNNEFGYCLLNILRYFVLSYLTSPSHLNLQLKNYVQMLSYWNQQNVWTPFSAYSSLAATEGMEMGSRIRIKLDVFTTYLGNRRHSQLFTSKKQETWVYFSNM